MGKRYKGRRQMKQSLRKYASDFINVTQKPDKFKMAEYDLLNRPRPKPDQQNNAWMKPIPAPKLVWWDEDGALHSRTMSLTTAVTAKQSDRHQIYDHWYSYKIYNHGAETIRMFFHGEFYFLQEENTDTKTVRRSVVYRSKQRAMYNLLNGKVVWVDTFELKT